MLTALVLICSVAATPDLSDCNRETATAVMQVPGKFGHPANCFMQAQAFLAATSLGQDFGPDDRIRILCRPTDTVERSGPLLSNE